MDVIKKFNLLTRFVLIITSAQVLTSYADQQTNNLELSPIITVNEKGK